MSNYGRKGADGLNSNRHQRLFLSGFVPDLSIFVLIKRKYIFLIENII